MIRLFVKMFGDHFWKNAIFEVTRWGFDPRSINNRLSKGESEEKWKQEWNTRFQHEFKIDVRSIRIKKVPWTKKIPSLNSP